MRFRIAIIVGKSLLLLFIISLQPSCKKRVDSGGTTPPPTDSSVTVVTPPDPEIAKTIGFFLNDWKAKTFTAPASVDGAVPATGAATITIDASTVVTKIPTTLFGNNANTWTGNYTDATLLNHITNQHPGFIRCPGGSISDVYFWNAPRDVKPADAPDSLLDADGVKYAESYWHGMNTDSWTCTVDNYYNMLQQTGNKGMITVNYAYARYGTSADPVAAAAHLAADWVRYDKGRTKYWEIGNENSGSWEPGYRIDKNKNKDGQPEFMSGDLYGRHVKVFVDSMKKAAMEVGATIYIGAQLVEHTPASWEPTTAKTWNAGVLPQVNNVADFFIVHNYYTNFNTNDPANVILATAATVTSDMTNILSQSVTAAGVTAKPIALTEYNISAKGSMQAVSHVSGMHAVLVINELMKNKFGFASRWDLANGWDNGNDMGLYNVGDEPGASKWNPRPAFYYLYFFQKMLGDRLINTSVTGGNNLSTYAYSFSSGQVGCTIVNQSTTAQTAQLKFKNFNAGAKFYWYSLVGGTDGGEFSRKVYVNGNGPSGVSGGPADYTSLKAYAGSTSGGIKLDIPARAVIFMVVEKK
ncbi:alpha-L-arabinofuranosidase [Niastella vici]|uniref:Alpha-L-arabinofuranosidase n=1 Tax=Niastella vici TaxID=1703345 RepID=A0A1V9FQY3_9BACT|nr:alpha-L-arabinofuranosidase [Niastella vici]OQP60728.1 alpha-L-arabinofuranosidase [Niastella vici]